MPSGNKDGNSKRGAIRRQRLRCDDSGGTLAGGPGGHPSWRRQPFVGPSSDGHADAPRVLPKPLVSSRAYLAALSFSAVTPVRALPTTSVSAVQPRITRSMRHCGMLEEAYTLMRSLLLDAL